MKDKPFLFGSGDLETDPFKRLRIPEAFAADLFFDDTHLTWWSKNAAKLMLDKIFKLPSRVWYFHNGGKFDFHFLIQFIDRKRISRLLTIGGRIVQIKFSCGRELRDSYALIPVALSQWAKKEIDITKLEKNCRETHKQEILSYLKSDTENLFDAVDAFVKEYGVHITLASAAFTILHKKFDAKKYHISEAQDAKFRRFYFAGRVEYFRLGSLGPGYTSVDINSSFPYCMTFPHWEGDEYITRSTIPKRNYEQSFFRLRCISRGGFPFRCQDGSVSFPDDSKTREYFVSGWEFDVAKRLGIVESLNIISVFTPTKTCKFDRYVEYFYGLKNSAEEKGDKGQRLFAKLLMNSGYGKFGIDPREFEEVRLCDWRTPPEEPGDWMILKDDPQNGITIYKKDVTPKAHAFNNVCVAASITGLARANLLLAMHSCMDVVYCDTDSIIAKNVSSLSVGPKLGQWKIEHIFDELHIAGKKLYAGRDKDTGKWKTASKGAKLSADEIKTVASGKDVTYLFDAPSFSFRNVTPNNLTGATKWARFTKRKIRRADKIKKYE